MSNRAVLPNRRPSWRRKFAFSVEKGRGELTYFGTVSYFGPWNAPDLSRPAEVFLDCGKATSDAGYQAEAAAIYASFALQHGCPLQRLIDAGPKLQDGSAAEPVGHFLKMIAEGEV